MSTSAHNKRIVIIAGPNGAGKTTFESDMGTEPNEIKNVAPSPCCCKYHTINHRRHHEQFTQMPEMQF